MNINTTVNMIQVNRFAQYVGEILQIKTPPVIVDYENKLKDEDWAAMVAVKYKPLCILIQDSEEVTENFLFMCMLVARELRHCYQLNNDFYLPDHKNASIEEYEEYQAQPEEIDAIAFSVLCMEYFFDIHPARDMFPESPYDDVLARAAKLNEELAERFEMYSNKYNFR